MRARAPPHLSNPQIGHSGTWCCVVVPAKQSSVFPRGESTHKHLSLPYAQFKKMCASLLGVLSRKYCAVLSVYDSTKVRVFSALVCPEVRSRSPMWLRSQTLRLPGASGVLGRSGCVVSSRPSGRQLSSSFYELDGSFLSNSLIIVRGSVRRRGCSRDLAWLCRDVLQRVGIRPARSCDLRQRLREQLPLSGG